MRKAKLITVWGGDFGEDNNGEEKKLFCDKRGFFSGCFIDGCGRFFLGN